MAGANQFKAEQFIKAMPGSGGIIAVIAKRVGCDWHTADKYIREFPTVRQAYEDECAGIDDLAESTVIKAIRDGDISTAKWWLEKRRRDRFGQTLEMTGPDGRDLFPVAELVAIFQRIGGDQQDGAGG